MEFDSPEAFRGWLEANHATASEIVVRFRKVGTGRAGLTWPQSVDEALCFGWIDGVRRGFDKEHYEIRFVPRRPGSIWSLRNVARFQELEALGRIRPEGRAAFERRREDRTGVYSFENPQALADDLVTRLKRDEKAWEFFQAQAPWYRRAAENWVMQAKGEATRERRFQTLLADSQTGVRLRHLAR